MTSERAFLNHFPKERYLFNFSFKITDFKLTDIKFTATTLDAAKLKNTSMLDISLARLLNGFLSISEHRSGKLFIIPEKEFSTSKKWC